ncbi:NUDIX domain-containing protein [Pseudolysinimonas sp.]
MDLDALRNGPLADLVDPAPLVARETAFAGKVWDIVRDTVMFGGASMVREYTQHTGAVAVLAVDDEERVLLINQYRQPIGTRDWELPAGLLDIPGEPPLVAAQRELAEEADLVAAEWSELTSFHSSPGGSNEVITIFEARGLSAAPAVHDRTDEEAEIVVRWVGLDEALDAARTGRLKNAPLLLALLTLQARRGSRD